MKNNRMKRNIILTLVDKVALALVVVGALHYVLAVFRIDLINTLSTGIDSVVKLAYFLIALSGLWVTYVVIEYWKDSIRIK